MTVFVAGATGVLGRPVVRFLAAAGHRVRAVARGDAKAAAVDKLGAEAVRADLFDAQGLRRAVDGAAAVLHLATHIPPPSEGRRRSAWVENDRLRRDATRLLVDAALDAGAKVYVQESVTFLYRDGGDRWLDEESPLDVTTLLESANDAERETARFSAAGGRGVVLRYAAFYGPEASSTQTTLQLARYGLFPVFGGGENYFSSVHSKTRRAPRSPPSRRRPAPTT
jgi:nucleoside-diphosphate-sugar epimerase